MQAEGQDQVAIVLARHGDGEVVVNALLELVQHRKAVRSSKVDFCLLNRISSQRLQGRTDMVSEILRRPGETLCLCQSDSWSG
jgi:hypothetical protein